MAWKSFPEAWTAAFRSNGDVNAGTADSFGRLVRVLGGPVRDLVGQLVRRLAGDVRLIGRLLCDRSTTD